MDAKSGTDELDISFVVIGFNEGETLEACLRSLHAADLGGRTSELIYVDGGSSDGSVDIAGAVGVDALLGGDRRRSAAENRNLGASAASGRYVQFVDGDMVLRPDWPSTAAAVLDERLEVAAVAGALEEANRSAFFRALQLDWAPTTGDVAYCGGAAMFRRGVLLEAGGFPEDVEYGEEPYLCWRIRNELGGAIHQLEAVMADHDLGFRGFGDYWRRSVRTGATYAEIAHRCRGTNDPLWRGDCISNAVWTLVIAVGLALLAVGPMPVRVAATGAALLVLARKAIQVVRWGHGPKVAALYALHTYFVKLPLAYGQLRWMTQGRHNRR
ncbi:MAG: glycosyltransferase [bacterium]|nr:glycosyltransferase [bacterium]